MNIRFLSITLLTLTAVLLLTACPDNPPTHHRDSTIHLDVVSEGTFSVTLNVSVEDSSDVWSFALNRNDSTVATVSATGADTTSRDGGLLPGHTYRYRAYWLDGGEAVDSSEEVTATTMDTTSHNFVFVQDTIFGAPLTSEWYDAAIINENDIWVGGYVLSEDYNPNYGTGHKYNAAHWDGNQWEFQTLLLHGWGYGDNWTIFDDWDSSGNFINNVYHIGNETWFVGGGDFTRLIDGNWDYFMDQVFRPFCCPVNCIWGTSTQNIVLPSSYAGFISTFNGTSFNHFTISPYEDIPFIDIWGVGADQYWIVGFISRYGESTLYAYNGVDWEEKYHLRWDEFDPNHPRLNRMEGTIEAVWAYGDTLYLGGWIGLWKESISTGEGYWTTFEEYNIGLGQNPIKEIRGQGYNDIVILGYWGEILHYNGKDWKLVYPNQNWNLIMDSVDFKDDLMVFVGSTMSSQAVIIRGWR